MQKQIDSTHLETPIMQIGNFSDMQARYLEMPLDKRASAVMCDASQAFEVIARVLGSINSSAKIKEAVAALRKNSLVMARIRPSEAKTYLMDDSVDFVGLTGKKMVAWQKMLENIAAGKAQASIVKDKMSQHMAINGVSSYLALIKLVIPELAKIDAANQGEYERRVAEIRRASTILSDCECASEFNNVIVH